MRRALGWLLMEQRRHTTHQEERRVSTVNVKRHRGRLTGFIVALVLLMNGCALTFGYRHADWLIRWQLDHYVDLTSSQRQEVAARLEPLLVRHRTEALPQYEQFLKDLQQRVGRGLSREDLEWTFAAYDRFRADLFERAVPEAGRLLTTLSRKQVRHLERVFRKEEAKGDRILQAPVAARLDDRTRKGMALVEEWLGTLSQEQSARVRPLILALPDSQPVWWDYRRQRHDEILGLLRHPMAAEEINHRLRQMFVQSRQSAPARYVEMDRDMRTGLTALVLETDRIITPLQRRHAVASIQKVIDELHALARSS